MSDYIKREAAIKIINQYIGADPIAERVEKDIPAADVVKVRHGRWEMKDDPYNFFDEIPVCSECGCTTALRKQYAYCPNCGAKMDGKEQEHETI